MVGSFEFLEHSADVRILAKGSKLTDLFAAGLEGLCEVMIPGFSKTVHYINLNHFIEIESIDNTALIVDFLSEVLSLSHQNKALFCTVKFEELTDCYLKAEISGFHIDEFEEDVKAVTYHEADVTFIDGVYRTVIVLDI